MKAVLCALLFTLSAAAETRVESELKRMTNELLDGITAGDAGPWKRYTHDRLIFVSENNQILTKAQLLEEIQPLPKGLIGRLEVTQFKVEVHGNVAVTTYIADEWLDYYGQIIENDFRTSDAWLKTKNGWRMISSQTLAILFDPPAITLPRETLCEYNGTYRLTPEITTRITCTDAALTSERTGRPPVTFKPEVRDLFFAPGAPRSRRVFLRDASGKVTGFADRREGLDVRWGRVDSSP